MGPPVEMPIATMDDGQCGMEVRRRLFALGRRHGDDHLRGAGRSGDLDFHRQLCRDLFDAARGRVWRFRDEIKGAEGKSFERYGGAALGLCAEDDHGDTMSARNLAKHLDAVHARHVQIERHDLGMEFGNLLQANGPVHGRANDFDGGVALQHLRDEFPHQRGVIHNQNADFFAHAVAPTAGIRARCEITAGIFRIKTTVPSPRMEAPLTNGEVTN